MAHQNPQSPHSKQRQIECYLMHLLGSALQGYDAKIKPEEISWGEIYAASKRCGVEGLSYYGMLTLLRLPAEQQPPEKLQKMWERGMEATFYRAHRMNVEREQILKEMDKKGLAYLPLKGILLQNYYPKPGMRFLADNDILYGFVEPNPGGGFRVQGEEVASGKAAQDVLIGIMEARGFSVENTRGPVDNYTKEPFYHFEMHRAVAQYDSDLYPYYQNPWKKAVRSEGNSYAFAFSDEDEYLYILSHAWKHYKSGGCGIRFLADLFVFFQAKGKNMDKDYVRRELDKMGIASFEADMRELAQKVFDPEPELTEAQERLLYELLDCGLFGTVDTHLKKRLEIIAEGREESSWKVRFRYIWGRLFPSEAYCRNFHPFFYRHRSMIGFLLIFRVGRGLTKGSQRLRKEWRAFRKLKKT